jgi:hypothetical protein
MCRVAATTVVLAAPGEIILVQMETAPITTYIVLPIVIPAATEFAILPAAKLNIIVRRIAVMPVKTNALLPGRPDVLVIILNKPAATMIPIPV